MLYTITRLAFVALAFAGPVPPQTADAYPDRTVATKLPEQRLSMEDVSTAFGNAQAHVNDKVDEFKQGVLDATDPAQIDPDDVTHLIMAHPGVGEENQEAVSAAVNELHGHLTVLHSHGFVDPGEGRWALGLQDFVNTALQWFDAHLKRPLSGVVDKMSEQMGGQDLSWVIPAVESMFAYLAELLGSAAIFLKDPSIITASQAILDLASGDKPDVTGFFENAMIASGCI
mmetsp:Transcript_931/g.1814  ORF Transcript_931/g.1814 Transcript_931/m.1814 type:complete len:229 (+) Transcript_931:206-892(+)